MKNCMRRFFSFALVVALFLGMSIPTTGDDFLTENNTVQEQSYGWGFIDDLRDVYLSGDQAVRAMGDEIRDLLIAIESGEFQAEPASLIAPFSVSGAPDMEVYDAVGFRTWSWRAGVPYPRSACGDFALLSSAYGIAAYITHRVMLGNDHPIPERRWQSGGTTGSDPNWWVMPIRFRPQVNLTEPFFRDVMRAASWAVRAYMPHGHAAFSFRFTMNDGYVGDVTITYHVTGEQWRPEWTMAERLTSTTPTPEDRALMYRYIGAGRIINDVNDATRLRRAFDFTFASTTYDLRSPFRGQLAYNVFILRRAVCNGYALAFSMLSLRMGLNAPYIRGDVIRRGRALPHAWNLDLTGEPFAGPVAVPNPANFDPVIHSDPTWGGGFFRRPSTDFLAATRPSGIEERRWENSCENYIAYVNGWDNFQFHDTGMIFYVPVDDLEPLAPAVTMQVGAYRTFNLDFTPRNATPRSVEWSITSPPVGMDAEGNPIHAVTINEETGRITALAEGTATVQVRINGGLNPNGTPNLNFTRTSGIIVRNILNYDEAPLIVPGRLDGSEQAGFGINLTAETIAFADGYTPAAFSVDGGGTWRAVRAEMFTDANFPRLLSRDMTLHVSNMALDSQTRRPPANATIITFARINGRPQAPRLALNYEIGADSTGQTAGYWFLTERRGTTAVTEGIEVALLVNRAVDENGWGTFHTTTTDLSGAPVASSTGIHVTELSVSEQTLRNGRVREVIRVVRTQYLIRTAPTESNGTFTAASAPRRITASSELRMPRLRINARSGAVRVRAGTYVRTHGEITLYTRDDVRARRNEVRITRNAEIWHEATARRPASAKQMLTR